MSKCMQGGPQYILTSFQTWTYTPLSENKCHAIKNGMTEKPLQKSACYARVKISVKMDPLSLLPMEVWRLIFKMLPLDDRVTAGQVSRSWRQFFRNPMMWVGVVLEVGEDPKHIKPSFAHDDDSEESSEWEDVEDEDSSGGSDNDPSESMEESDADSSEDDCADDKSGDDKSKAAISGNDKSEVVNSGDEESEAANRENDKSEANSGDEESEADNSGNDKSEAVNSGDEESEADNSGDDQSKGKDEQSKADNCGGDSEGNSIDDESEAVNLEDGHQGCDDVEGSHEDCDGTDRNASGGDDKHGTSGISEDEHVGSVTGYSKSQCSDDAKDAEAGKQDPGVQENISRDLANGGKSSEAKANGPSDESNVTGKGLAGNETAEKPACLPGRAVDRTSCRVLRAAPCLRAIVVRGWRVSAPIMKALMETTAKVTCLNFTTFIAAPKDAEKIVSKLGLHLEELHFREASRQLLELLSVLRVPRLRNFAADSVAECPLGSDLYFAVSWIKHPLPAPTPAPLVAFIKAHSSTLRYLTIGNMWSWVTHTMQVMEAVSSCRGLTHLGVLCSEFLRIGPASLPALTHLSIKLMIHNDDKVDHRLCLEPLPPSLEELDLSLILVDLSEVLDVLVRQAPSLPNLRKLHVQFIVQVPDTVKQLQRLRAAFPGVTVSSEARIDCLARKENQNVFRCTVPGSYIPPAIDWS
ncbi:uncharacterized protein LOC117639614 isoform X2 [Thrips palmi]|uniref:Uncharacterized protein LOC117639614 isoform X2 n=1 Tax=Thrips palmi TaxID=161013 RepID=A0A6P8Y4K5_THRPL|nr:uncharacterized protein LOC117639614 isoform X2 [Thrips palmi]